MVFLILAAAFIIRALPRFIVRDAYVSDTLFHLYCARIIRENRMRIPSKIPRIIIEHEHTYPFGYHYVLALFAPKYRLWAERLSGAFFDTMSVAIVYLFTLWFLRYCATAHSVFIAVTVTAAYAFSPALMRIGSGPRAYNGTARVMGEMLYLLHMTSAIYALYTHNIWFLSLSIVTAALCFITSKFSTQAILFNALFISAFVSLLYIPLVVCAFVCSCVFTSGRSWHVMRGQIQHSIFYARHLQAVFLFPIIRTARAYLKSAIDVAVGIIRRARFTGAWRWFLREKYPIHLLIAAFPHYVCIPWMTLLSPQESEITRPLYIWAFGGLFWFFATKIKPLLFLGEGERYLEHALLPSLILAFCFLAQNFPAAIYCILGYSILAAIEYVRMYIASSAVENQEFGQNSSFLQSFNKEAAGVLLPIGPFHWKALYATLCPILFFGCNIDERLLPASRFMRLFGNYPLPGVDFPGIIKEFKVAYIMSDDNYIDLYKKNVLRDASIFDRNVVEIYRSRTMVVYKTLTDHT